MVWSDLVRPPDFRSMPKAELQISSQATGGTKPCGRAGIPKPVPGFGFENARDAPSTAFRCEIWHWRPPTNHSFKI